MDKKRMLKKLEKQFNASSLAEVCFRDGRIRHIPLNDGIKEFIKGTAYYIELPLTPAEESAIFEYNSSKVQQAVEKAREHHREGIPRIPYEPLTDPDTYDHADVSYRDGTQCIMPLKEAAAELKSGRAYAAEVYLTITECLKFKRTRHHAAIRVHKMIETAKKIETGEENPL